MVISTIEKYEIGRRDKKMGVKAEVLSRTIMVGVIEKVICEQRHSEIGDEVTRIFRGRAFEGLGLDMSFVTAHTFDLGQVT